MSNIIHELRQTGVLQFTPRNSFGKNKTNIASLLLCLISSFNLEFEVTNERQFEKQNKVF